ncbi:hypothetical protein JAAARDRAFT_120627 [Jaapia argillacea MUCL 33604]|uniref:Amidase domain-containing protein n=1 Tax=Jaapia argillacea MUCL 33604 TaxID=933084 RepID=A0A067QM50_9AGAM|nr:hypothetical protein JAAARDRAFT_120627 [Jaapia argillacea MUCL 33604]
MNPTKWQELVEVKRQRLLQAIPRDWIIPPSPNSNVLDIPASCAVLSPLELEITNTSDVSVLLSNVASSKWTSLDVTRAFCKRAAIAHQLTNCLTEIFFEPALESAAKLDDHLKRTGTPLGPLHGLPVSLKDQYCVKGVETSMGYASWLGVIAEDDAAMVKILRDSGAIPYVRTNVPQTLMWTETHNNVFGRTVNPYNRSLTPGGSSGGEAALLAMRGSILGIGTDVGGSSRVPAHFCGIYGFKPSYHRLPTAGMVNSLEGQDSIATCVGPLSTSLSGIKVLMKASLDSRPWNLDPYVIRKPWDEDAYALKEHGEGKSLCFGIMYDDETLEPHPPVKRALEMTKKAVEAAGHSVIEWKPYKNAEIYAVTRSIWLADGGADYKSAISASGEPMINSMKPDADPSEVPYFRKPREPLSAYQLWQLHAKKRQLRKDHLDRWQATASQTGTGRPIDALICPVAPYVAVPHGQTRSAVYTLIWNALDYPALVLPVTTVDPSLDVKPPMHEYRNCADQCLYKLYDPEVFKGAPVGVQLVTQTQEEEALLAIGAIVDEALKAM